MRHGRLLAIVSVVACAACGASGRTLTISSMNMVPTLQRGDQVHVTSTKHVDRGRIILFRGPSDWVDPQFGPARAEFISRVVAIGGDHISCCDAHGAVDVDGKPLAEPYLAPATRPSETPFDVQVPPGYLWILGDNRAGSSDSRTHMSNGHNGAIPASSVVGVVTRIISPKSRARRL